MEPSFTVATERNGEVLVLVEDLRSSSLQSGFILYNRSTPEQIDAFVTITSSELAIAPPVRNGPVIELDDQHRVYMSLIWGYTPVLLFVFDCLDPPSLYSAASLYTVKNLTDPSVDAANALYARGDVLIVVGVIGAYPTNNFSVTQLSTSMNFSRLSYYETTTKIEELIFGPEAQVIGMATDALVLFDAALTNVVHVWPLPFQSGAIGSVVHSASNSVYAFYSDHQLACAILSLSAVNTYALFVFWSLVVDFDYVCRFECDGCFCISFVLLSELRVCTAPFLCVNGKPTAFNTSGAHPPRWSATLSTSARG